MRMGRLVWHLREQLSHPDRFGQFHRPVHSAGRVNGHHYYVLALPADAEAFLPQTVLPRVQADGYRACRRRACLGRFVYRYPLPRGRQGPDQFFGAEPDGRIIRRIMYGYLRQGGCGQQE
jgi:hypothetical protein